VKPAGWINPHADLLGVDGNALSVMGLTRLWLRPAGNTEDVIARLWLRPAGNTEDVIARYTEEARSGGYDHLGRRGRLLLRAQLRSRAQPLAAPWL
jgi:hypothetical protein